MYRLYQAAGSGERVTRVLTAVAEQRGWPAAVRGDHGPAHSPAGAFWPGVLHTTLRYSTFNGASPCRTPGSNVSMAGCEKGTSMPNGFRPLFDTRHTIAVWRQDSHERRLPAGCSIEHRRNLRGQIPVLLGHQNGGRSRRMTVSQNKTGPTASEACLEQCRSLRYGAHPCCIDP